MNTVYQEISFIPGSSHSDTPFCVGILFFSLLSLISTSPLLAQKVPLKPEVPELQNLISLLPVHISLIPSSGIQQWLKQPVPFGWMKMGMMKKIQLTFMLKNWLACLKAPSKNY